MAGISFKVTEEEMGLIEKIVARAERAGLCASWYTVQTCTMDLCACQANGNALRLADLLAADDFNFTHDIAGIARHMDRNTGQLKDCFYPRFIDMDRITYKRTRA